MIPQGIQLFPIWVAVPSTYQKRTKRKEIKLPILWHHSLEAIVFTESVAFLTNYGGNFKININKQEDGRNHQLRGVSISFNFLINPILKKNMNVDIKLRREF
jgi:hypothetical protein